MTEWLTGTFIATNALVLGVLALREPVRRHFSPSAAYALWLFPAARAILPSFTKTVERSAPLAFPDGAPTAATAVPPPPEVLAAAAVPVDWIALSVSLWLAGAAIMLALGLRTFFAQRRRILADASDLARIGSIRLVRSGAIAGPVAFGIFDRVIAVPLDFDQRFTERQRCLALEHELAHHRSGDLVANFFAFVLLCLQWFNPLAWAAHSAFRFDQEAACDARVLDKVNGGDRLSYGTAIAKAASGPAFLSAGALDRPSTLSRRLTIMSQPTNRNLRRTAFILIGVGMLCILPLTATTAITYVDAAAQPQSALERSAAVSPIALAATTVAAPTLASLTPAAAAAAAPGPAGARERRLGAGKPNIDFIGKNEVRIDGLTKRWEELTPEERGRIRTETDRARKTIEEQVANLPQELERVARDTARFHNGEFKREMIEAKANMQRSLAELEANSATLRAHGEDPERIAAQIRKSLQEVENMDIDKVVREAVANIDVEKIRASILGARDSLDEIDRKLDQLDRR